MNEDLTRADGVIQCRQITDAELLHLSWQVLRLIKIFKEFPITF